MVGITKCMRFSVTVHSIFRIEKANPEKFIPDWQFLSDGSSLLFPLSRIHAAAARCLLWLIKAGIEGIEVFAVQTVLQTS